MVLSVVPNRMAESSSQRLVELRRAQHLGRARAAGSRSGTTCSIRPGRGVITTTVVGEEHRLGDRVGDEQGGGDPLGPDPLQLDVEALAGHLVERAEGLVEQQHPRLGDERAGDRHALAHAARQLRRPGLLEALQADELDEVGDGGRRDRGAGHLQGELDVRLDRAPRQQRRVLEGDAEVMGAAGDVGRFAVHQRLPRRRRVEAGEDAQDRRLAAPRRAEQRGERPGGGVERDVVEGVHGRAADGERLRQAADGDARLPRHPTAARSCWRVMTSSRRTSASPSTCQR